GGVVSWSMERRWQFAGATTTLTRSPAERSQSTVSAGAKYPPTSSSTSRSPAARDKVGERFIGGGEIASVELVGRPVGRRFGQGIRVDALGLGEYGTQVGHGRDRAQEDGAVG